jgi:hypothetical protein
MPLPVAWRNHRRPAARSGPARACTVADEVAALALVPGWADRTRRHVLGVGGCSGLSRVSRAPFATRAGVCGSTLDGR